MRLSVQPVRGGGAGGVAAGRMPQPGSWEILGLVGLDTDLVSGLRGEMGECGPLHDERRGGTPGEISGSF